MKLKFALCTVTVAATVLVGIKYYSSPRDYDECILSTLRSSSSHSVAALSMVRSSCKQKFPIEFDFDALAVRASTAKWSEVAQGKQYQILPEEQKKEGRSSYFDVVVKPLVHPDFIQEAAVLFEIHARRIEQQRQPSQKNDK